MAAIKVGDEFGYLKVVEIIKTIRQRDYRCECQCGNSCVLKSTHLSSGKTSCGCKKHGLRRHYIYAIWHNMVRRCYDKNNAAYDRYGERGIMVCERWRESVAVFFADMGERPGPEYSVDRRDNDGDYGPDNCFWATDSEQSRNRRDRVRYDGFGQSLLLCEWEFLSKIGIGTLWDRIKNRGMTIEQAVTTPDSKGNCLNPDTLAVS